MFCAKIEVPLERRAQSLANIVFRVVNAELECTARKNLGAIDTYEHKKPKRENEGETLGFMTRMKSRLVIK